MLGYVEDGQRVAGEISAHKMISACDFRTHRERDKPDVVVDGKTTFSSSVSIALIVSKLRRGGGVSHHSGVKQIPRPSQGGARDDLP